MGSCVEITAITLRILFSEFGRNELLKRLNICIHYTRSKWCFWFSNTFFFAFPSSLLRCDVCFFSQYLFSRCHLRKMFNKWIPSSATHRIYLITTSWKMFVVRHCWCSLCASSTYFDDDLYGCDEDRWVTFNFFLATQIGWSKKSEKIFGFYGQNQFLDQFWEIFAQAFFALR